MSDPHYEKLTHVEDHFNMGTGKTSKAKPKTVAVLVQMYEDLVDNVHVFAKTEDAERQFRKFTKVSWNEYVRRTNNKKNGRCEDAQDILGDYAGTTIFDCGLIKNGGTVKNESSSA